MSVCVLRLVLQYTFQFTLIFNSYLLEAAYVGLLALVCGRSYGFLVEHIHFI